MTGTHTLTTDQFAELATGGSDETVGLLRTSRLSKNLVLIRAIMHLVQDGCNDEYNRSDFASALTLLDRAQQRAPEAVAAVLTHPHIGAWAGACLVEARRFHRLTDGSGQRRADTDPGRSPLRTHLSYAGAIAAAAAVRAGHPFTTRVAMRDGQVMLPTLGRCSLQTDLPAGLATIEFDGDTLTVSDPHGNSVLAPADLGQDAPGWQPLRRLTSEADGLRLTLDLDDIDPYRNVGDRLVADRLTDQSVQQWQRMFDDAWRLLVTVCRDRAEAMVVGLVSLVPSPRSASGIDTSSTLYDAFGAMVLSLPYTSRLFAETLVHEFQHSKLSAIMDLVPLSTAGEDELFYSPARDDPRPIGGILHGAYAYAGVADYWRRYRGVHPEQHAEMEFARWREQVERVCDALLDVGRLTPSGVDFVTGLRAQMRRWNNVVPSSAQRAAARDDADDHHLRWRLRNLHPDPAEVARLTAAWQRGESPPGNGYTPPAPRPAPADRIPNPRFQLRQLMEQDPKRFAARAAEAAEGGPDAATAADFAYLSGDAASAAERYQAQIDREPDDTEHWAGLVLARRQLVDDAAARTLQRHPELIRAVYLTVRAQEGSAPDLIDLAGWLDGVDQPGRALAGVVGGVVPRPR